MSNLRSGSYGSYYGSFKNESKALTNLEMQANALYIKNYLLNKSWSIHSICALLGNMQAESSLNPGRWQSDNVGITSSGYGLVQWTPATKYIDWCSEKGLTDYSEMDSNLARIVYEVENNIQWIATSDYDLTFTEFTFGISSTGEKVYSLRTLTEAFLINYERPADQSNSVKDYRTSLAEDWYTYLSGNPIEPNQPTQTNKKKKYNFLLFNARKRRQYG